MSPEEPRDLEFQNLLQFEQGTVDAVGDVWYQPEETARAVVNLIPQVGGGLTWRDPFLAGAASSADANPYPTAVGPRGTADYDDGTTRYVIVFQRNSATSMHLWRTPFASIGSTGWTRVATPTMNSGWDVRRVSWAQTLGKLWYVHPYMPQIRYYSPSTGDVDNNTATDPPSRCRAIAFHKERLFAGGGYQNDDTTYKPTWLWYSKRNDATTGGMDWFAGATPSQYIPVGEEDGDPIVSLFSFDGNLMIGKTNSLWILMGDGPASFQLQKVADIPLVGGTPFTQTPQGLVFASSTGVYLWQGGYPTPIMQQLGTQRAIMAQATEATVGYLDGRIYVVPFGSSAAVTVQMVYDMGMQKWWFEDNPYAQGGVSVFSSYLIAESTLHLTSATNPTPLIWYSERPFLNDGTLDDDIGVEYYAFPGAQYQQVSYDSGFVLLSSDSICTLRHLDVFINHSFTQQPEKWEGIQLWLWGDEDEPILNPSTMQQALIWDQANRQPPLTSDGVGARHRIDLGAEVHRVRLSLVQAASNINTFPHRIYAVDLAYRRSSPR